MAISAVCLLSGVFFIWMSKTKQIWVAYIGKRARERIKIVETIHVYGFCRLLGFSNALPSYDDGGQL